MSHDLTFHPFCRSVFGQFISLTDFASGLLLGYLSGYKEEKTRTLKFVLLG